MAAEGSSGAGGPLLRVADMLQDLAEDSNSETSSSPYFSDPGLSPSASKSKSGVQFRSHRCTSIEAPKSLGLGNQDLPTAFEETYSELNVALTQSGHTWTGLTQQLCATLATSDKLIPTSQLHLGQVSQEVKKLEKIVERGQEAVTRLQIALGQAKDKVPVS